MYKALVFPVVDMVEATRYLGSKDISGTIVGSFELPCSPDGKFDSSHERAGFP